MLWVEVGSEPTTIKPESRLLEDLECDSLDIVQIVMAVEEEFDIDIEDEEAEKLVLVKDIHDLVEAKLKDR